MVSQAVGWYPDPSGGGGQRYWDGATWTEHNFNLTTPLPTSPPAPPKKSVVGKAFKVIGWGFAGLLVLGVISRAAQTGVDSPESRQDRAMNVWVAERLEPKMRGSPQLWLDYSKLSVEGQNPEVSVEKYLDDLKTICGKMYQKWVVDLDRILPAPVPAIDGKFRGIRDAARTATENCTALSPSYTQAEGFAVDQDFVNLQSKFSELMQEIVKYDKKSS